MSGSLTLLRAWYVRLALVGALLAFVGVLVAFGRHLAGFRDYVEGYKRDAESYRREVEDYKRDAEYWARRDLRLQAELVAPRLCECLDAEDYDRADEIFGPLEEKGMAVSVHSQKGGWVYTGRRSPYSGESAVEEAVVCGNYRIVLSTNKQHVSDPVFEPVFEPYERAVRGFVLSAWAGGLGMLVVFVALYWQGVRIRELDRLEKFRRAFIADVSHEIKTPLTGILGAVDLLKDDAGEADDGRRRRLLAMIEHESVRLNALVRQILDLARLERRAAVKKQPVDIVALVRETVDVLKLRAEAAKVELAVEAVSGPADGDSPSVACDGQLIAQALSNLIVNALVHSGSPTVGVAVEFAARWVHLHVEDHGVGVPSEHVKQIFERFHRVDPARCSASGGAGLGLAIVRQIVRLHGGEVRYEDAKPSGARFTISLPR